MITKFSSVSDFFRHAWNDFFDTVGPVPQWPESTALYWIIGFFAGVIALVSLIKGVPVADAFVAVIATGFFLLVMLSIFMLLVAVLCGGGSKK
jgi:hypothetical protein